MTDKLENLRLLSGLLRESTELRLKEPTTTELIAYHTRKVEVLTKIVAQFPEEGFDEYLTEAQDELTNLEGEE